MGGAVAGKKVDAVETLLCPRAFFFGDKCRSESGLERTHHSFRVGILRGIGALTTSVILCWKDLRH